MECGSSSYRFSASRSELWTRDAVPRTAAVAVRGFPSRSDEYPPWGVSFVQFPAFTCEVRGFSPRFGDFRPAQGHFFLRFAAFPGEKPRTAKAAVRGTAFFPGDLMISDVREDKSSYDLPKFKAKVLECGSSSYRLSVLRSDLWPCGSNADGGSCWEFLPFRSNHPGADAPPLLIEEGSLTRRLPS